MVDSSSIYIFSSVEKSIMKHIEDSSSKPYAYVRKSVQIFTRVIKKLNARNSFYSK